MELTREVSVKKSRDFVSEFINENPKISSIFYGSWWDLVRKSGEKKVHSRQSKWASYNVPRIKILNIQTLQKMCTIYRIMKVIPLKHNKFL